MISTNSGKFRRHSDDKTFRECAWSGRSTPQSELAAEMVSTARTVLNLADVVRDEDPGFVWKYLGDLARHDVPALRRLAFVALAAVPAGQTLEQAFAWVLDLPAARFAS
ncbi:hypothetical protein MSP7336_01832 [Mycobacterium shimoidei]|uniref:Uncharacterized protein n=2 Tax=Mycobacterium shimoidei TaxID=29313 RepID=A0A375YXF2_MYCSH|nr:hypothetical protein MSP7336_01832 [Mycobacterium shimoidei]